MKVRITFDISDDMRRAYARRLGRPRLATRKDMRGFIQSEIAASLEDVWGEYMQWSEEQEERRMLARS
jgi:hypothetical protein